MSVSCRTTNVPVSNNCLTVNLSLRAETVRQTDVRMGVGSDAKEAPPLSHLQPFLLPYLSLLLYSVLFYSGHSLPCCLYFIFIWLCFFYFLHITYLSRLLRKWIEIVLNMGFEFVLKMLIFGSVDPKKSGFYKLAVLFNPSSSVHTTEHILTKYAPNV